MIRVKVNRIDQEKVVIFLPKPFFSFDFEDKEKLEENFKELFLKLEDRYELDMSGFYQIKVYQDLYYGAILDIEQEELPYFDCFDRQVEMSIQIMKDSFFLYQVEDILEIEPEILKHSNCYIFQEHFFLELVHELPLSFYIKLLESSTVVYGRKTQNIIKFGHILDFSLCK